MTGTFRALCAELTAWAEKTSAHYFQPPDVLLRARAALADEPAVPEGREPVAVTEQPSDEELALIYHDCCRGCEFMDQGGFENAARAVLARWGNLKARVTSSIPADGEVAEQALKALQDQIDTSFKLSSKAQERVDLICAALERLQELENNG